MSKNIFVTDIRPGDRIDDIFCLAEKQVATKKDGGAFLKLTLADATGKIPAVLWEGAEAANERFSQGDYLRVAGRGNDYQGRAQMVVDNLMAVDPGQVDPKDFVASTKKNVDEMFQKLRDMAGAVETPCLRDLLDSFFDDEDFRAALCLSPAAKKMHHAWAGGLLEHTLWVTRLCKMVAEHYPGVDTDLLLAGAILHDVGKTVELSPGPAFDYTTEGRLLGHIVVGLSMIDKKIAQQDDFPEKTALLLRHLVASHHGSREFGSPETPKTIEGVILNQVDDLDAKVTGIQNFMEKHPGDGGWTSYHRLMERFFFTGFDS